MACTINNLEQLTTCILDLQVLEGGDPETSGLGPLFNAKTVHLTDMHARFLKHWERLVDLEASHMEVNEHQLEAALGPASAACPNSNIKRSSTIWIPEQRSIVPSTGSDERTCQDLGRRIAAGSAADGLEYLLSLLGLSSA